MSLTRSQVEAAARYIVGTRDFCGDEHQCFRDTCEDNKWPYSIDDYQRALTRADEMWSAYTAQARRPA